MKRGVTSCLNSMREHMTIPLYKERLLANERTLGIYASFRVSKRQSTLKVGLSRKILRGTRK